MKKLLYTIVIPILLASCTNTGQNTANIELIEKYVKAVEAKDYNTMEMMLAEDYKGYGPSHGDSTNREAALAAWKNNIENLYESIAYQRSRNLTTTIKEGDNQGDWVTNWAELSIKYKDGRGPVTVWASTAYRLENGKINRSYTIYNEADVLAQLGYIFINPEDQ